MPRLGETKPVSVEGQGTQPPLRCTDKVLPRLRSVTNAYELRFADDASVRS